MNNHLTIFENLLLGIIDHDDADLHSKAPGDQEKISSHRTQRKDSISTEKSDRANGSGGGQSYVDNS